MTGKDRGAVFVEAMIASAIVAMALGTAFQVLADGARREGATQQRRLATLVAQSEMADVGADIPLSRGDWSGVSGPFVWRVAVAPYAAEGEANRAGALWRVEVAVRARAGGAWLADLSTVRLGA